MDDFISIEQPAIQGKRKEEKKQTVMCYLPRARSLTLLKLDDEQEN